uniref:Uncharacterized protein n=1 Tax=Anguilla anguilla TaxID=7936 RepID=A0A0E9S8D1_ANGAN
MTRSTGLFVRVPASGAWSSHAKP